MNILSIPVFIISAISLYVAVYYLIAYLILKERKEYLYFSSTCFFIFIYDFSASRLYNSVNPSISLFWQRFQFLAIPMSAISLWFFIYETINKKRDFIFWIITTLLFPIGFFQFFWPDLCFITEKPIYRKVFFSGLKAEFVETAMGPFAYLLIFLLDFTITYLFINLLIYYRRNKKNEMFLFLTSSFLLFSSIIIDSLIGMEKINFIYTSEYSYVALILVMDYSLLKKFLTLHKEVSNANVKLEEQVRERTVEIRTLLEELKVKNIELSEKVDEAERAKNKLFLTNTYLENIMNSIRDILIVTDNEGKIVKANREGINFILPKIGEKCSSEEDIIGKELADFFGEDNKNIKNYVLSGSIGGGVISNYEIKCKAGDRYIPFSITASPYRESGDKICGSIIMMRDITDLKEMENNLRFLATHDTLTRLPNRLLLTDRANQAIAQALRYHYYVGVLLIDFDHFKEINDTLGHHIGDELLKEASKRIEGCLRDYDTVSRMGGDEFVIVLGDLKDEREVEVVCKRILRAFENFFIIGGKEIMFTPSIGISLFPVDGNNIEALLKAADIAMYRAKSCGGNGYCYFSKSISETVEERIVLKDNLKEAIKNGELELYYQPLVDYGSGKIVACEALLRWRHKTLGMIEPMRFIPLAESTGLIVSIGDMVLKRAMEECKRWHDEGFLIGVSVNVSGKQLEEDSFVEKIGKMLKETGISSDYLILEIKENMILDREERYRVVLEKLRETGIKIYIDNFGKGISYLRLLKGFPVNAIKIDRLYTQHIYEDEAEAAIVKTIIALSKSLDLKVVLEGIEKREQLESVKSFREGEKGIFECDQYQGYFFSKPLPPPEVLELLKKNLESLDKT